MDAGDFAQLKQYLKENLTIWHEIKPGWISIWIELENETITEELVPKANLQSWLDET